MAWCGCFRKGRRCRVSSGGGVAGWSASTSTPYIPWRRRSNKALRPFSGGVCGWVCCAKNWQLLRRLHEPVQHRVRIDLEDPCGAANAQALSEAADHVHDEVNRDALAVE